jgi:hypothetical protein
MIPSVEKHSERIDPWFCSIMAACQPFGRV